MSAGASGKGPSIAELQRLVREKKKVDFLLVTGEKVVGVLRWFDEEAFSLILDNEETLTLLRSAVIGYRLGNPSKSPTSSANKNPNPESAS